MILKRVFLSILPILCYCLPANAQENWVTIKGDKHISVKFPSAPVKEKGVYTYTSKDSTTVLIFCVFSQDEHKDGETPFDNLYKNDKPRNPNDPDITPKFETGQWNGFPTTTMVLPVDKGLMLFYTIDMSEEKYMFYAIIKNDKAIIIKDRFLSSIKLNK